MADNTGASPINPSERIQSIDVLRGFAVLGILIMNIQDFSMVSAAYFNPTAYGDLNGANWYVWVFSHLFADQKFMTLFSLLFGAGVVLFSSRAESKGVRSAGVHYRRTLWLLVFGMLHGYLLWSGDILYAYAMCSFVVFLFRRRPPKTLLILGLLTLVVGSSLYLLSGLSMSFWPEEQVTAMSEQMWAPGADAVAEEVATYSGSYVEQMEGRIPMTLILQTQVFLFFFMWRAGGIMLIGMALFKWGVLSAQRSKRFYTLMVFIGFAVGIPLIMYGINQHVSHDWSFEYSYFLGSQYNYWGSLFVAGAYIGCIMLAVRSIKNFNLLAPLSATGRMAFTNYIMQTIICTLIFYGHGLGKFGSVERTGQILIVLCILVFQVVSSHYWLKHFRFGPLEWLWRSLTYWKQQPMRRT